MFGIGVEILTVDVLYQFTEDNFSTENEFGPQWTDVECFPFKPLDRL